MSPLSIKKQWYSSLLRSSRINVRHTRQPKESFVIVRLLHHQHWSWRQDSFWRTSPVQECLCRKPETRLKKVMLHDQTYYRAMLQWLVLVRLYNTCQLPSFSLSHSRQISIWLLRTKVFKRTGLPGQRYERHASCLLAIFSLHHNCAFIPSILPDTLNI